MNHRQAKKRMFHKTMQHGAWILSSCADKSVDPLTASIDELFDIYSRSIKESNSHK